MFSNPDLIVRCYNKALSRFSQFKLYPVKWTRTQTKMSDFYRLYLICGHHFLKFCTRKDGGTYCMDIDWHKKLWYKHKSAIREHRRSVPLCHQGLKSQI